MKYNLHIDNITSKASRVLGFVKRNLRHCPKVVKERAYQSLVLPKLEYSSTTWNPQQLNKSLRRDKLNKYREMLLVLYQTNHLTTKILQVLPL